MFYKNEGKWTEVPYIQLFFFLRDHPRWLSKCRVDTQTMVTLTKSPQTPLRNQNQKHHLMPKGPQQHQKGPPCDRNQISRGATWDISHPEDIG
jgi:hypothetical protein